MTNEEFRLLLANYPDEYFVKNHGYDPTVSHVANIYIGNINVRWNTTNKEFQELFKTLPNKAKVLVYGAQSFWYSPLVTCIDGIVEILPNKDEDQDRQPGH